MELKYAVHTGANCITTSIPNNQDLIDYQCSIITEIGRAGLLSCSIHNISGDTSLFYHVSSLLTMEQYFQRGDIIDAIGRKVLIDICETITSCKNYLLWERNLVLDIQYIFVEPSTGDVRLIYLPFKLERKFEIDFCNFMTDVTLLFLAKLEKSSSLPSELADMKNEGKLFPVNVKKHLQNFKKHRSKDESYPNGEKSQVNSDYTLSSSMNILEKKNDDHKVVMNDKEKGFGEFIKGLFRKENQNDVNEKKIVDNKIKDNKINGTKMFPQTTIKEIQQTYSGINEYKKIDETQLLSNLKMLNVSFEDAYGNNVFDVQRTPYRIGRIREQVDFQCDNPTVGKVHAEILLRGFNCYIKDLNSKNGTFINGNQIMPNEETQIASGDIISFSNIAYRAKILGG